MPNEAARKPDAMNEAGATSAEYGVDDRRARRNALILSAAHALYGISATILITLGGLVGHMLADDKSLATLPISTLVAGTALSTVPASFLMRAVGRRNGFILGATASFASALLGAYAIVVGSFWLFCAATSLQGVYQAFSQYYRFAAADTASAAFRPKAISWVLAGGLAAAVVGPQTVIFTKDLLAPIQFAGSFVAAAVTALVAMAVVSFVDIPPQPRSGAGGEPPRAMSTILAQPKLIVAILCGMVSFAVMNYVMTATPLAMVDCGYAVDSAAWAIQWHILAMFGPSFVTGQLIQRFGRETIVIIGLGLLAGTGVVALSGIAIWQFNLAMVLLGVGWNFSFIGATTMVADCHRPEERGKVQALNEFMIFGSVALASFASGKILHDFGWAAVNWALLPFVALAVVAMAVHVVRTRAWRPA